MGLRDHITSIAHSIYQKKDFDIVHLTDWLEVFKKIEARFIKKYNTNTKFNWWWENLKDDNIRFMIPEIAGYNYLHYLVNPHEKLYLVISDSDRDPTKQWIYEGYIAPIQYVLSNLSKVEYYIVSKKYDWLLAENHHNIMIASGTARTTLRNYASNRNWEQIIP